MDPGLVEKQDISPMASGGQLIIQLVLHRDHCVPIVPVMEDWSFRGGQWEFSWMGEEQVD